METKPKIRKQIRNWSLNAIAYAFVFLINYLSVKIGDSKSVIYYFNFIFTISYVYLFIEAVYNREGWIEIYKNPTLKDDYFDL
jgi:hypothetical protein